MEQPQLWAHACFVGAVCQQAFVSRLSFASPADSNGGWGNYYGDNYPYYGNYDSGSYGGDYNGYSGEPDMEPSTVISRLPLCPACPPFL